MFASLRWFQEAFNDKEQDARAVQRLQGHVRGRAPPHGTCDDRTADARANKNVRELQEFADDMLHELRWLTTNV